MWLTLTRVNSGNVCWVFRGNRLPFIGTFMLTLACWILPLCHVKHDGRACWYNAAWYWQIQHWCVDIFDVVNSFKQIKHSLLQSDEKQFVFESNLCGHVRTWIVYLMTWWLHQMETFSTLLAICAVNSPVTGEFPAQRPVTQSFDVFFDLHLNKWLSKQSWGWWFGAPSLSLWRHYNDMHAYLNRLNYTLLL